jgi:hypothetical protein
MRGIGLAEITGDDDSLQAFDLILAAFDEGSQRGVAPELIAYAALFTALSDLVGAFGEEAVATLARGLERRVMVGEFTLCRRIQ